MLLWAVQAGLLRAVLDAARRPSLLLWWCGVVVADGACCRGGLCCYHVLILVFYAQAAGERKGRGRHATNSKKLAGRRRRMHAPIIFYCPCYFKVHRSGHVHACVQVTAIDGVDVQGEDGGAEEEEVEEGVVDRRGLGIDVQGEGRADKSRGLRADSSSEVSTRRARPGRCWMLLVGVSHRCTFLINAYRSLPTQR